MCETSPSEIDWLAFGREDLRRCLTREEQELLLTPHDISIAHNEAIECLRGGFWQGRSLTLPFSWDYSAQESRAIPFRLQCFTWQACLMVEFFRTGDITCRDLLLAWVFDWIDAHPTVDRNDLSAWHDDAAGRRALFFGIFLIAFEKIMSDKQIGSLRKSLAMHAGLLRSEDFYRPFHNHGFYQDMALAVYALSCGEDADYWSVLSAARTRVYLNAKISTEGVHLEHSPIYHFNIARGIAWLAVVFRSLDPDYAAELTGRLNKMAEYGQWISLPNGALPSVGDSPREKTDMSIFACSAAAPGQMRVFPQAGYAFIRKDRDPGENSTWMMFLAATHGEVHKHNDDLSFLLYHGGGELFTEAGKRNYNYSEPETEYCYSSYGHNVLFVNGVGWPMKPTGLPLLERDAYATGIVAWEDTPTFSGVTGRQIRFPGVIQERTLCYDRQRELVTVEDRITLESPATLKLIYHLAPDVTAERTDADTWTLFRGGVPAASLSVAGNRPELHASVTTESILPWRTEIYWGDSSPRPGSLFSVELDGDTGLNILRLSIALHSCGESGCIISK